MKSLSWIAIFGLVLFVPLAVVMLIRNSVDEAADRRYDTSDYVSDEPL